MGRNFKYIFGIVLLWLCFVLPYNSFGTHLRAGEIIVKRDNCSSLTFSITILVYLDLESGVNFGNGLLRLGDGSDPDNDGSRGIIIPEITSPTARPDLGVNVGTAEFTYVHTYGAPGKYIISYYEQNRNGGILNMDNSINTTFFIEAEIIIDPFLGCNNSPVMLIPPVDKGCPGVAFYHNPGAYDPDGDSLSYELTIPKKDVGTNVDNYRDPNRSEFFSQLPFENEEGNGTPTFSIDPVTGDLIWDTPGDVKNEVGSEYNIAFIIREWRKINGEWYRMGYVVRDMQIIIEECDNDRPELIVPEDICVEAGTLLEATIEGTDINGDPVKIEAFSQLFDLFSNPASYTPNNGVFQSTVGQNAKVDFTWQTDCSHVRDQPYQVVFKITDNPANGPRLVSFKTWNITVIAPEPEWVNAQIDFPSRSVDLEWNDYQCLNAEAIQIWRRVDSYNYVPGECETGMPDNLGYQLIDLVNPATTTYQDDNNGRGLDFGAKYCYRLVAIFPLPLGGESIISQEICVDPVEATGPVITHVTVDRTSTTDGQITVSWKPPFDIDTDFFGSEFTYRVQRGEGLVASTFTNIGTTTDTTFTDTGLNTETRPYTYRIVLFSEKFPTTPIEVSSQASSVWLQTVAAEQEITLFWLAQVPWSNNSQDYPWHYIYRGSESDPEEGLTLIDSVNVNAFGYTYTDRGQWNNTPLDDASLYCYYVITQGTYGNDKIEEPILNKSQRICAQPNDDEPPCTPVLVADIRDCEEFIQTATCDFNNFENLIKWNAVDPDLCQTDILHYEVYVASSTQSNFQYYTTTVDTFLIDSGLPSFARCYKIKAIDRSGNESEFSNTVCFDNCPYYELPNVITPDLADFKNDVFRAYSSGEKCARFVVNVNFSVFNRWGRKVYEYQSGGENTIYINWNGKDSSGKDLSAGVYYYLAEVEFDRVNPDDRIVEYKGWVHIIR